MEAQLFDILKTALEIENREIELTDQFKEYDEWDSLGRLSLIAEIDTEFEVQIDDKDFENLQTVEDLLNEIKKRKMSPA